MKKKRGSYHTFQFVLKRLLSNPEDFTCIFENRPTKYKFGTHNYGEIPIWYNKADGDPWDIFAPGYKYSLPINVPYKISKVIGVYVLENGNHKIAVRLKHCPIHSRNYEKQIIMKYTNNYTKHTRIKGQYMTPQHLAKNIL